MQRTDDEIKKMKEAAKAYFYDKTDKRASYDQLYIHLKTEGYILAEDNTKEIKSYDPGLIQIYFTITNYLLQEQDFEALSENEETSARLFNLKRKPNNLNSMLDTVLEEYRKKVNADRQKRIDAEKAVELLEQAESKKKRT